jgi:hypothetical protein
MGDAIDEPASAFSSYLWFPAVVPAEGIASGEPAEGPIGEPAPRVQRAQLESLRARRLVRLES